MNDFTLIANSGIHFKTIEVEFNPENEFELPSGKSLGYTFIESKDYLHPGQVKLDVCSMEAGMYSPVNYILCTKVNDKSLVQKEQNGLISLDECGVPKIVSGTAMNTIERYLPNDPKLMNVSSLSSLQYMKEVQGDGYIEQEPVPAFELLLGKWLPMPMYEYEENGYSTKYPNGWCRVRIDEVGKKKKDGTRKFRFVWAFDTSLAKNKEDCKIRPVFLPGSGEKKIYQLCNRPDLLLGNFLTIPDGKNEAAIGDYLVSLWNIDLKKNPPQKFKFIAYYIYFINLIRLMEASPIVKLYNKEEKQIPVDMSIDIGNSRTCAVLFEDGDFTKGKMLRLTDLTRPWLSYNNAFDMRIVFRKADFGGDITLDKGLFQWQSLVRVGKEASFLVYHSREMNGESERVTNYSSPKRYLWDNRPFENKWEQLVIEDDPTNVQINHKVYMKGFTDHFDNDGVFLEQPKGINLKNFGKNHDQCHYSRQSLMTFVMVEILQHAICYINSEHFRNMHDNIDCKRYLRNIIVTCPTAMPLKEQYILRKAAKNATILLRELNPTLAEMTITPDPEKLLPNTNNTMSQQGRGWLYDEAFASQLVYLWAEIKQRYKGRIDHFFKLKGHQREEIESNGMNGNGLTIGTIDIGAGTTDVMITAFGQKGQDTLVPIPLFFDSFYSAGDDILHNIIRDMIIEGPNNEIPSLGGIESALSARIQKMTPDEILQIPRVAETRNYTETVENIRNAMSDEDARIMKNHLIYELMHHFFGGNSAGMSAKDRRCRLDFCTQVSHPMSQFFLELLKQGRPQRVYSFDEIFQDEKPASYLLQHFEYHFGFRFEDLSWRYDPEWISKIVTNAMRPIMKALAEVVFKFKCDYLVLSGRPTNLKPITELILEYIPVPPNRLVCLNQYHVGRWFPLSTQEGYFMENQKAVVAVGAEVGYLASGNNGLDGMTLDFSIFEKVMKSTACYMGLYDEDMKEVKDTFITPQKNSAQLKNVSSFPYFIGCKQFDSPKYQARPLYVIYNNSGKSQLTIRLQRSFNDKETITITGVSDKMGNPVSDVEIRLQTIASDGEFWMDKGAFQLTIQEN